MKRSRPGISSKGPLFSNWYSLDSPSSSVISSKQSSPEAIETSVVPLGETPVDSPAPSDSDSGSSKKTKKRKKKKQSKLDDDERGSGTRSYIDALLSDDGDFFDYHDAEMYPGFFEDEVINLEPRKKTKADTPLENGINWLQERSKVFVAIDIEFWEVNHKFLTEIGIAVYDPTRLLPGSNPLFPNIKSCHLVVSENKSKTNGRYVANNMFKYSYGETSVMSIKECRIVVNELLASLALGDNLVIVGHGVSGDIKKLKSNDFKFPDHEVLDTMDIWRQTHKTGPGSLTALLEFFGIPHGLLHNAGNDAYLNMALFLSICDPYIRDIKGLDDSPGVALELDSPKGLKGGKKQKQKKKQKKEESKDRKSKADELVKMMLDISDDIL